MLLDCAAKLDMSNTDHLASVSFPEVCTILSIPVHDITHSETLDWIEQAIISGDIHQVCTVNPEFVMAAQKNAEFRRVLQTADLCIPDGQGLLWATRRRSG